MSMAPAQSITWRDDPENALRFAGWWHARVIASPHLVSMVALRRDFLRWAGIDGPGREADQMRFRLRVRLMDGVTVMPDGLVRGIALRPEAGA